MSPAKHLVSGIILGGITYAATNAPGAAMLAGAASIASDLDHAAEYGIYCVQKHKKPMKTEFLSGSYFREKGTIIVGLHAYEYAALLLAALLYCLAVGSPAGLYIGATLVGYTLHLVLDLIGNDFGIKGYSLIYRIMLHFREVFICYTK